jgi:hypothetical protein
MRQWDGGFSKDRYWGHKRGHTILDVKCFCGKLLLEWQDYANHMRAKHPKMVRKLKKSGQWQQDKIDWKVRKPEQNRGT